MKGCEKFSFLLYLFIYFLENLYLSCCNFVKASINVTLLQREWKWKVLLKISQITHKTAAHLQN